MKIRWGSVMTCRSDDNASSGDTSQSIQSIWAQKINKNLRLILLEENNHFARPRKISYSLLCFTNTIRRGFTPHFSSVYITWSKKSLTSLLFSFEVEWTGESVFKSKSGCLKICWSPVEKCINRLIVEIDKKKYSIYGNKSKTTSEVVL